MIYKFDLRRIFTMFYISGPDAGTGGNAHPGWQQEI
jgi:hypothetical protein